MTVLTENMVKCKTSGSDLANIKKLNCWGSSLTDVSVLRKMPNVQVITLSVNKITTLEDFAYCPNLEELYVRRNEISDLSEVLYLQKCPRLRFLWLGDNPCAAGDRYRSSVLRALPHLQKLDNIDVEPEEVKEALEKGRQLTFKNLRPGFEEDYSKEQRKSTVASELKRPKSMSCLGLKKTSLPVSDTGLISLNSNNKNEGDNVLQAAIWLVQELDLSSLEILQKRIDKRKRLLQEHLS